MSFEIGSNSYRRQDMDNLVYMKDWQMCLFARKAAHSS